jgi:hypothetical protein
MRENSNTSSGSEGRKGVIGEITRISFSLEILIKIILINLNAVEVKYQNR